MVETNHLDLATYRHQRSNGYRAAVRSEIKKRMSNMQASGALNISWASQMGILLLLDTRELSWFRIRRVKCDESQPHCQRCTSTGRTCDGYGREVTTTPAIASPASMILARDSIASVARIVSNADDAQERRSFDFFCKQTAPNIAGFFGSSTWNLVLQACSREPAISQAVIALGALHEGSSISLGSNSVDCQRQIQTGFPIRQYSKALGGLRRYLSIAEGPDLNIVLICAMVHISIEVIQNNYANAIIHLENSLQLLRQSSDHIKDEKADQLSQKSRLENVDIETDLARAFFRLDLQASTYVGRRAPVLAEKEANHAMPARFSSISQAKDVLDSLNGQLYTLIRNIVEPYRYVKDEDIPVEAVDQIVHLKQLLDEWDERFEKYLSRSTSRFSRQEQLATNALLINHRISAIQAATCTQREASIFDDFDTKFDEIVTLAAAVIWARSTPSSPILNFSLDGGVIYPLYWTAIECVANHGYASGLCRCCDR